MNEFYILGIDQSTQGTKVLLVNEKGMIVEKATLSHQQIINDKGWVSHDPNEIYHNILILCDRVLKEEYKNKLLCISLANQRETTVVFSKHSGLPLCYAIVWQCARSYDICERLILYEDTIFEKTGLKLSPYFPASKMSWLLENIEEVKKARSQEDLAFGTIDSYLIYRLTNHESFKTDYSNASRTQLFNLHTLSWDVELCQLFAIPITSLPDVADSDSVFGFTDLEGILKDKIPICGVLGDSHAALFAHHCYQIGDVKATYGTGSSIMLNIGSQYVQSKYGLSTSLAWKIKNQISYILEGNINYTGATITWLKNDLHMISSIDEIEELIELSNQEDKTYIVPAFTGLGAPYWKSDTKALICGISRYTTNKEIVKAGCESIAYQINDVLGKMRQESNLEIPTLYVDGGPTSNQYLMQFQSDISDIVVKKSNTQELSALGVIFIAGLSNQKWTYEDLEKFIQYQLYESKMCNKERLKKLAGWRDAIKMLLKEEA